MGATATSDVRLTVHSQADDVTLVRQVLSGVGEAAGIDGVDLNDVNTAVTEACNNVVMHAYSASQGAGEMTVDVSLNSVLVVTVEDHGRGIGPVRGVRGPAEGGLGIPVMLALASTVEYREAEPSGTIVRMCFDVRPAPVEHAATPAANGSVALEPGTARLAVGSATCAPAVCRRLLVAFAARARLSSATFPEVEEIAAALATLPSPALQLGAGPRELLVQTGDGALPELGTLNLLSATLAGGRLRVREV
ncbi:MAG TPA: ATP-binding protein [Solirubrobacteraceae bacterium]|nr:ATP-binding protein [Solirubrobacteraceae bacterium]